MFVVFNSLKRIAKMSRHNPTTEEIASYREWLSKTWGPKLTANFDAMTEEKQKGEARYWMLQNNPTDFARGLARETAENNYTTRRDREALGL